MMFAEQIDALVKQHLSEEGKYIFSHFVQSYGFLLLSLGIAKMHGADKAGFKFMVDEAWKLHDGHIKMEIIE
jgi:hypothetical protein